MGARVSLDEERVNELGEGHVHTFLTSFVSCYEAAGLGHLPVVENCRAVTQKIEHGWTVSRVSPKTRPSQIQRPQLRLVATR